MMQIILPRRPRQRPTKAINYQYGEDVQTFCVSIMELQSRLDFEVSSRGWCYILEEHGLLKGDFDTAQTLINDCRKSGALPLDICAEDGSRSLNGIEDLDERCVAEEAKWAVDCLRTWHMNYTPFSFWDNQKYFLVMAVEKIDLRSLFSEMCKRFRIPITNLKGWSDLNARAKIMRKFAKHEAKGRRPVLLYCGDHDPAGINISSFLKSNLADLSGAVGWSPDNLIVQRFGLNYDFIMKQNLSWIDNLETGSGKYPLNHKDHPDHNKPYVQNYIKDYGVRKVEANALVVRPEAGRQLALDAILQYVDADAPDIYEQRLRGPREELRLAIIDKLESSI